MTAWTHRGSAGFRRVTSSTTLKSSIFWSGALGPQVTSTSSLLGSQHAAVISDGALPTLWQMLRRFLIVLEVNERSGRPLAAATAVPQRTLDGLMNFHNCSLAGRHQKSIKEELLPGTLARVRGSLEVIYTHCAARWPTSHQFFFPEFDGRQFTQAHIHRHMYLTVQLAV